MRPDNLHIARDLIAAGIPVLLVDGLTKRPLATHGFHDATLDLTAVTWQMRRNPTAMVAFPTGAVSGCWVLDIDRTPDGEITPAIAALKEALRSQAIPQRCGLVIRSPRIGFHGYFGWTPGVPVRNSAGDIGPGIDTRGYDASGHPLGYIIAPGNVRPDGKAYVVIRGAFIDLLERRLPQAARELLFVGSFSTGDRKLIAANPDLEAAIAGAEAIEWHGLVDAWKRAHQRYRPMLAFDSMPAMRRQAVHDLNIETEQLSALQTGRRSAVFRAAARLARYVANSMLTEAEVTTAICGAYVACSGPGGRAYAEGAVRRALQRGAADPLPPLARAFRTEEGMRHVA